MMKKIICGMALLLVLLSMYLIPTANANTPIKVIFNAMEPASITVTSPNGGENWERSTIHTIKWNRVGSSGSNMKIELFKAGVLSRTITASTTNDGSKSWTIPSTQALGTDYKIKITNISNLADYDFSDNNFTISGLSITVTSPNGGENWTRGTTYTIKWNRVGSTGSYVKIELLKGDALSRVISSSTSNDGSYSWTVPSSQTLSNNYKIRITSTSNPSYTDTSDNNFMISNPVPSITVTSPNGGENWARSTTHTIKWNRVGSTGSNVKIELFRGSTLSRTISSSTSNDGSYSWTVPSSQTLSSSYKIKITSNSGYYDWSNNYFRIS